MLAPNMTDFLTKQLPLSISQRYVFFRFATDLSSGKSDKEAALSVPDHSGILASSSSGVTEQSVGPTSITPIRLSTRNAGARLKRLAQFLELPCTIPNALILETL